MLRSRSAAGGRAWAGVHVPGGIMWRVLPVCVLLLGLLVGTAPRPVRAAGPDASSPLDAVIAVREADLSALLSSRLLGEHSFMTAADLGLDEAALASLRTASEAAVLPRSATGRDGA